MKDGGRKIFIIEDDRPTAIMLKMLLEFNGYETFLWESSTDIEENLRKFDIDLVMLDLFLGKSDGSKICLELKSKENTKEIPVLMMSALEEADKICLAAGADDFVSKPFDLDELKSKIATLLSCSLNQNAKGRF